MAKQNVNKRKNSALESHKKSDKAKWAITFISLILIATLLGGLSFYVVNNNKTNNPPAIEQGQEQGKTEEPTVSNIKNFASVNDFITDSSKTYTNNIISEAKMNEPEANYVDKDVTLNLPLKLKLFDKTIDGECLGEVNIEKMELKGIYSDTNKITIGYFNITNVDLISLFPNLSNYQLSTFDFLNEGKPGQTAGEDFFFANSGYIFNLNQREPGEPAIRIIGAEMPSDNVVELQQLEIGVVLQKIV